MPGSRGEFDNTFINELALLRTVTIVDTGPASVPLSEILDTRSAPRSQSKALLGYNARINIYIYGANLTAANIQLWYDVADTPAAPKWCLLQKAVLDGPEGLFFDYLVPGRYAVVVSTLTAVGNVEIYEQHTE